MAAGLVKVAGTTATKPATAVEAATPLVVEQPAGESYVSRGGHKLAGALDAFGYDPAGKRVLDAGASTGGFTDVLLRRGAAHVVAADVGYGQLAWSLQTDERVTVLDRTNVRSLELARVGAPVDLVVADLSFIPLGLVLPALWSCCRPDADLLPMVKPQFEVGRLEASATWAKEHLGFSEAMAADGFCSLSHPEAGFNLIYLRTGLSTFKPDSAAGPADGLLVVFTVEDVDADYARLKEQGAEIVTPIETEPWGERYFQMADPNGVVYQLVQWVAPTAP